MGTLGRLGIIEQTLNLGNLATNMHGLTLRFDVITLIHFWFRFAKIKDLFGITLNCNFRSWGGSPHSVESNVLLGLTA